jgi:PKD repeat protein
MQVRFLSFITMAVAIVVSVICSHQLMAQTDTLKVMYYNTLNFPNSGDPIREAAFRQINGYLLADVILVNELLSDNGGVKLLNSLNVFGITHYQKAVFSDGPDTDNMLFYNSDLLALHSQHTITTALRNIEEYVLYYKSAGLESGEDTIFFYFYSAHLKASQGFEQERLEEVNNFKTRINSLINAENIVFGGDMNFYTYTEPAYQALINDGIYPLHDPLPAGNWHDNNSFQQYHTQSTRLESFGGGSIGGLDDRFDFMLFSDDLLSGTHGATYIDNTCMAFGNDGNHLNKALIDPPVNPNLPDSIIQSLYLMSDHLPVVCDIKVDATTVVATADIVITEIMYNPPEVGTDSLEFIELYNNGLQVVNLAGYQFTSGIDFVFPAIILQPGEFITVAYSSQAMLNTFGVESLQWNSDALNNSGEPIVLKDNFGYTIDLVYYDDVSPWPTEADEGGPSLVLCDPDSDNALGVNWAVSEIFVLNNANGDPIYASPSSKECALPPVAGFSASQVVILTGESVAFTDASANNPTSWNWEFDGGNPVSSAVQNPTVVYSVPGLFNVQLTVSNTDGSNVLLKTNYITVLESNQDLMITEIMQNPGAVDDNVGEWFEVFNPTNSQIDMIGWKIKDNDSDAHTIASSVIVPAMGFAVLGTNNTAINGNYTCNYQYVYNNFQLANGADEIVLLNPENEEIDRIEYDGGPNWPDPTGASMVFTGSPTEDNMNFNLWETSSIRELAYQGTFGDKGSPGISGLMQNLFQPATGFELQLKVYLEGPFNGMEMNTSLPTMPLSQPYFGIPWNYPGSENVTAMPSSVVDWVLVELRDASIAGNATPGSVVAIQAALLLSNGSVVSMDGSSHLQFENLTIQESLFVVVYHRNHMAVMSANPLVRTGDVYTYDFTDGSGQAYNTGQKHVGSNKYAMFSAETNSDEWIDTNDLLFWIEQAGTQGYKSADFDLNGQVNNQDKIGRWLPNNGQGSQLPE